jgi:phosphoglycolate phosphatase
MLLIFDIDGTLFEGHRASVTAVREAFASVGLPPPFDHEVVQCIGTSAVDYETWFRAQCNGVDADALLVEANRLEVHHVRATASLYDGALEMVRQFKGAGHFIATATNAPRDYFDAVLDGHGLRPLIDLPLCKGDGFASKRAMVATAMKKCGDRPAVVIGDRRDDVDAAHANGAIAIGTAYGYGGEGELAEADAIVRALGMIPSVLP